MNLKQITPYIFFQLMVIITVLTACHQRTTTEEETIVHSNVQVVNPVFENASVYKEFQGTTRFMQHLQIRAQSSGIIANSFLSVGQTIHEKQPLVVIKSREATLLNKSGDPVLNQIADTLFAFSSGIVEQVVVQPGDFVQQGDLVASCVNGQSLNVVVSVPLDEEISEYLNKPVSIILPDGKTLIGTLNMQLPIANDSDQTGQFLVKPDKLTGLSENMHVLIRIKKSDVQNGLFVPKDAIFSNEELTNHWVYKIVDDSVAVKISVDPMMEMDSMVQIEPVLTPSDRIIAAGGYGLPDSSLVKIVETPAHEEE